MLLVLIHACGYSCGEGTTLKDGSCVATGSDVFDSGADPADTGGTDSDTSSETDSGGEDTGPVDSDSSTETGSADSDSGGTDTGSEDECEDLVTTTGSGTGPDPSTYTGPCAPPDVWTGDIDPALYTNTPFVTTYDAGLADIGFPGSGSGSWPTARLIVNATVVGIDTANGYVYIADAAGTVPVITTDRSTAIGDLVTVAVQGYSGAGGTSYLSGPSRWVVMSRGSLVPVVELGSTAVDYSVGHSQFTHVYGELTRLSTYDCDTTNFFCVVIEHDGREDKLRLPNVNTFGIDRDYNGGLCAEVVAPVGTYSGTSGATAYLDVQKPTWMRVWPAP